MKDGLYRWTPKGLVPVKEPLEIAGCDVTLDDRDLLPRELAFVTARLQLLQQTHPNVKYWAHVSCSEPIPDVRDNVRGKTTVLRLEARAASGLRCSTTWFDPDVQEGAEVPL